MIPGGTNDWILAWLVCIPILGGILAWASERIDTIWPRRIALATLAVDLIPTLLLTGRFAGPGASSPAGEWLVQFHLDWIPRLGIGFTLAADGLSLLLVLLTVFLGIMAVVSAWTEIREQTGFFYFHLLWVLGGITGVFLAMDLFLFYFFWEMMLIPMYFIIAIWGHENRKYASTKFFLFTQLSGLFMLVAILALYFVHGRSTGIYTFDYRQLIGTPLSPAAGMWIMLGFLVAFAVKLPVFPLHTWLPDAHTEAPTPGSVILAGLLLKTGAYGMLRFIFPLFPMAARDFIPAAMVLGVITILYGAVLAFAQTDLKRLVAYTSVSHMGFVLVGVFARHPPALQGVVLQIICHGIGTGALFMLVGALQERIGTRDMEKMGGLWLVIPRMGGVMMVFAMASLGLPGMGNFLGEFLVLLGAYRISPALTAVAALGFVAASVYALRMMQRAFHGPNTEKWNVPDLNGRETAAMAVMVALIVWLGLFPQWALNTVREPIRRLERLSFAASAPPGPPSFAFHETHPSEPNPKKSGEIHE